MLHRRGNSARLVTFVVLIVALVISLVLGAVRIFAHRSPPATSRSSAATSRPHRARTVSPTTATGVGLTGAELQQLLNRQLGADASRVSIAIRDRRSGIVVQAGTTKAMVTASIIKVALAITVVEPILSEDEELDKATAQLVEAMICSSDNAATQKLFERVGPYGLAQTYRKLRLSSTSPAGSWGMSKITSMDQLTIIDALVTPNEVVGVKTQDYLLHLMGNIDADQRWGISAGTGEDADVLLKNGWLPLADIDSEAEPDSDQSPISPVKTKPSSASAREEELNERWVVHSSGIVVGDSHNYEIVIMTQDNSTFEDGVALVESVSRTVYLALEQPLTR